MMLGKLKILKVFLFPNKISDFRFLFKKTRCRVDPLIFYFGQVIAHCNGNTWVKDYRYGCYID